MTDAPERITAWVNADGTTQFEGGQLFPKGVEVEYIRVDLAAPQWQPIETAPKDGTNILLLIDEWAIEGYWRLSKWPSGSPRWDVIGLPSHGCGCCSEPDPEPTHWMPLPDAPEESQ